MPKNLANNFPLKIFGDEPGNFSKSKIATKISIKLKKNLPFTRYVVYYNLMYIFQFNLVNQHAKCDTLIKI